MLSEEFLVPFGITAYKPAKDIGIPQTRVSGILKGNRRVTADTALRLSRYFGNSAKFWLGLQNDYDREEERAAKGRLIDAIPAMQEKKAWQTVSFLSRLMKNACSLPSWQAVSSLSSNKNSPIQNFPYLTVTIDCLKRLAAILLLFVLVFNFCGYRPVLAYMNDAATAAVEKKADADDYADSDLVSIKTTLHLPYYTSSNEFERAYGSININGQDYEYVKRRVHNDTLELLCLPNAAKTKLTATGNELVKASADGNASAPTKKSSTTIKINLPDFYQTLSLNLSSPFASVNTKPFPAKNAVALNGYRPLQERPPQAG